MRVRALAPLLFLSGAAALILEVAWFRRMAQIAGGTSLAMAAVLAAVIGGMALGAWWLGRVSDRVARPVRLYGLLELGVALFAVASPWLLDASEALFVLCQRHLDLMLTPARFLLAVLLLAAPAVLMGGTLPAAAAQVRTPRAIGWLYAINTFGAVAGTLLAGFDFLPRFGLAGTMRAAAVFSLAAGAGAMLLKARATTPAPSAPTPAAETPDNAARRAILLYAISGFLGLAAEVAFTRSLVLVFGSTTYAFSTMLAVFLLGIAMGGAIGTRVRRHHLRRLETVVASTAAVFSLSTLLVYALPRFYLFGYLHLGGDLLLRFLVSTAVLLPGAIGLGIAFPLAAHLAAARDAGRGTGRLYAANTVASVAGSTLAVFLLIPLLGPQHAIGVAAGAAALLALCLGRRKLLLALVLACAAGLTPPTAAARERLVSGVYFAPDGYLLGDRIDEEAWSAGVDVPFVAYGRDATVSIWRWYGKSSLLIDGKTVASNSIFNDVHHLSLLGHLPMAVHKDPQSVLVVGLGMGTTYRAVADHAPEELTVVEIERAVAEAAARLGIRPTNLVIADARAYLKATRERFDVITSDPIHPWVRGGGDLYTREYLLACRDRLEPGGVVCHWLPVYQTGLEGVRDIVRTFCSVFKADAYYGGGDLVLIGTTGASPPRPRPVQLPAELLDTDLGRLRVAGHDRLTKAAGEGAVLTDDALKLEFSTPHQLHNPELAPCLRWIQELWSDPPPPYAAIVGAQEAWARDDGAFMQLMLDRARKEAPKSRFLKRMLGELALLRAESAVRDLRLETAGDLLRVARVHLADDPRVIGISADLNAARGRKEEASRLYRVLLDRYPDSTYLRRKLAKLE